MGKTNWPAVLEGATSTNSLNRKYALSQAVTELEKALTASGIDCRKERKRGKSLADMLLDLMKEDDQGEKGPWDLPMQKETFSDLLREGVAARNKGVHRDADVGETDSEQFVEIIHIAWQFLRARFATQPTASSYAKAFLDMNWGASFDHPVRLSHFSEVYLFGSLTKHTEHAGDIDLLLVDAVGQVTPIESGYSHDTGEKEQAILRELDSFEYKATFSTRRNIAAIQCGWLNLSVIGQRFGSDRAATLETAELQKDPFFYLNVAHEMLRYDLALNKWVKDFGSMPIFHEFAKLRDKLTEIGIVSDPVGSRAEQRLKHAITLNLDDALIAKVDGLRKNSVKGRYLSRTAILDLAIKQSLKKLGDDPVDFWRLLL
jgi:hypothetical protein